MRELSPVGRTAMGAALQRIAHLLFDGEPKILVDSLAQRLLGLSNDEVARAKTQFPVSPSLWVLRSRYTEDRLAEATARGVTQYIILGAGLDTFAYRASGTVGAVRVYEVDTPESQSWKRDRLNVAHIPVPPPCVFVPCHFEAQSLTEAFAASPFVRGQATFVSWLGVTQDLNRHAIVDALRWIAGLGPRTELVLTYCVPDARSSSGVPYAERRGARFVSLFSPDAMEPLLHEAGFADARALTLDEARAAYFEGRSDGLDVEATERLIWARVSAVRPATASPANEADGRLRCARLTGDPLGGRDRHWKRCVAKKEEILATNYQDRISIEPGKRGGKPCIRGMRITVYDVLEYLASGMSEQEIIDDFPDLTSEDIRACLAFAADRERKLVTALDP